MRKLMWAGLGLILLGGLAVRAADTNAPAKPRVGIFKCEVSDGVAPAFGDFAYGVLLEAAIGSAKYAVVDGETLGRVTACAADGTPTIPADTITKLGQQLGVEKVFLGSVGKIGPKFYVKIKVVRLDLTAEASRHATSLTGDGLERAIRQIAIDLGLTGAGTDVAKPVEPVPAPAAERQPVVNSLGMKFVPVPATKVLFCVWETRVRDFQAFVADGGRDMGDRLCVLSQEGWKERTGFSWTKPGFAQTPDDPVVGVSWNDATAFCEWLTRKERKDGRLQADQCYRLPTDEEWSAAAGIDENPGGLPKEKDGKGPDQYPWGRSWPPPKGAGNYAGSESRAGEVPSGWTVIDGYSDGYARTAPAGSFDANAYGLFDMGGNVWEWCADHYDNEHDWHVLRGGSWVNAAPADLLSSYRCGTTPSTRYVINGFRAVLASPPR